MKYDPFQQRAIDYIKVGHSVIVSAPTGAGKTVIAEHVINDCLEKNTKAVYTAPVKALSNQKFREFNERFPGKIGILTGDVSINSDAPILIMTTEIFRNKVLEETSTLEDYSWIIFDEIHYLDDYERGTVWEESLIFLPKHMKMLALSATIPNIEEFADWIKTIHEKPIKIVKEEKRPVPLHFFYQCKGEIVDTINKVKLIERKQRNFKTNRIFKLLNHLQANHRLPCIFFAFGRRRCEYLAEETREFDFLKMHEKTDIIRLYNDLCARFDLIGDKSAMALIPLIEKGVAFHHAGMLPTLKEVVERLFTSRLIKVIFTTETFALGINMPAKTVVFDELRKFYGRFHRNLRTRDFYQMAGRAGRRSIDTEGFVYSRINSKYMSFYELKEIIFNEPEKVHSRFNASYATVLNLYEKYGEKLYDIYPRSFHYFQEKKKRRDRALEYLRSKVRILKELEYIKDDKLTIKGSFAAKIHGYELSLSELHEEGILEQLSEIELGILALALVFEPRRGTMKPVLNKRLKELSNVTEDIVNSIQRNENRLKIMPLSKEYHFHLAQAIEAWMRGEDFDKMLRYAGTDEGEIIRYFRMAIQILREVLDTPISHELKARVKKAIHLINRDIIDAEKQLRM